MVTASRLSWILRELQTGRLCKMSVNTHEGKANVKITLMNQSSPHAENALAIAFLTQLMHSVEFYVAVDHGHRSSAGIAYITIKMIPPQKVTRPPSSPLCEASPFDLGPEQAAWEEQRRGDDYEYTAQWQPQRDLDEQVAALEREIKKERELAEGCEASVGIDQGLPTFAGEAAEASHCRKEADQVHRDPGSHQGLEEAQGSDEARAEGVQGPEAAAGTRSRAKVHEPQHRNKRMQPMRSCIKKRGEMETRDGVELRSPQAAPPTLQAEAEAMTDDIAVLERIAALEHEVAMERLRTVRDAGRPDQQDHAGEEEGAKEREQRA
eukprot:TRINITY_DN32212_c0_g1_i1.p1 TRINITY_DN32212_c0_g1~~TRINITY_DN32212_c0_g1_i1.p1  ORF type:complete len:323 (+),score=59.71 TRINITY_DN32212_c0_g1_i1:99-1067(+)